MIPDFKTYYWQEKSLEENLILAEKWSVYTLVEGYLVDVSLKDLKRSTKRFEKVMKAKADREENSKTHDMDVLKVDIIPFRGTKTVLFNGEVSSSGLSQRTPDKYKTVISFERVNFFDDKKPRAVTVEYKNRDFFFERLDASKLDIKVRCGCSDFRFRAAEADRKVKGLITVPKFPRYIPKGTGQPVNPRSIPMLCKHLILFWSYLQDKKYIRR